MRGFYPLLLFYAYSLRSTLFTLTTRMGFEPTTSAVTGRRSNQLSHRALLYIQNYIPKYLISIHHPRITPLTFMEKLSTY